MVRSHSNRSTLSHEFSPAAAEQADLCKCKGVFWCSEKCAADGWTHDCLCAAWGRYSRYGRAVLLAISPLADCLRETAAAISRRTCPPTEDQMVHPADVNPAAPSVLPAPPHRRAACSRAAALAEFPLPWAVCHHPDLKLKTPA